MTAGPARLAAPPSAGATPAMAQWFAAKAEHQDALLFFRMGDFYELFFADAEAAAAALDIALSHRGEHNGHPIPMCGVPHHAAEIYLARLIRRGFRVAIVEQMEDPKSRTGKAPIRREVVRLITPGTVTEEALLDAGRPNLLLALAHDSGDLGAAWVDVSTGVFETTALAPSELAALLGRLEPAEILAPEDLDLGDWAAACSPAPVASPPLISRRRLAEAFGAVSLDAFGTFRDGEAVAAAMVLDYVRATQSGALPRLGRPEPRGEAGILLMDASTRASLEIQRSRDGGTKHTLLAAVQRTQTAAGARLLATWLSAPLTDPEAIGARQDAWSWCLANPDRVTQLRGILRTVPDVARALGRLSINRGSPRDLAAIRDGLTAAAAAAAVLDGAIPPALIDLRTTLAAETPLSGELGRALADPAPARLDDGGAIRAGYDGELDAYCTLRDDSRRVLATLQLDYAQRYGVASLKIRHHAQLGYVIEVPAAAVEGLRAYPELSLRQGMANGARFTAPELSELDQKIREAGEKAAAREKNVFAHLVHLVLQQADALAARAAALAFLDIAQSAARLAEGGNWTRPVVTPTDAFQIRGGRHPVVEAALSGQSAFVPNACDLSPDRRVMLLTGPNMAGKSTFLRQNALFVVLAQCGLPVPADHAEIGIVDRLFSRVGAADDLARGRSTFMVEMTETATILHQAGPRSMVVVDEIGRGTSTLDGLAIAWAVLEALHSAIRCRTIFATHFHELADLADQLPRLRPHTMRVKEWKDTVVFLHEVAEGSARRSWGVHVAELAGVPSQVVRRAAALMATFEKQGGAIGKSMSTQALPLFASAPVPAAEEVINQPEETDLLRKALQDTEPDNLTPRQALDLLYHLKSLGASCAPETR
ncbi:DNA mismatch repair protein MutS [Rhodopila sp.]|uniref:DNA mismatch repair protein MutS n=1 Tax=Rhodopila sp. TaxID=2480087 RepID=UPI002CE2EEFB|nr:DNA mismatch repair protein MutS [Rhodopila sp.]HVZ09355.1 DNA mismatch repair protein MutS [Rhodopila sp.]